MIKGMEKAVVRTKTVQSIKVLGIAEIDQAKEPCCILMMGSSRSARFSDAIGRLIKVSGIVIMSTEKALLRTGTVPSIEAIGFTEKSQDQAYS